ncbi:MAG: MarR family transcriptional regulator [Deltaproteobacteria bacterium]|nr:MarR family transcriptional regulator [Deltaproteobacteria bacterium]MBW2042661.1 MarR family transcriptional regulator [Deltaproteobacteria bacterium]MBW2132749.1 MarR family transcriptional regulator [Deltaproteobacteria bacterium]
MHTENAQLVHQIVGGIRKLVRAVYIESSKIGRQYGLTGAQSAVLRTLFHQGPMSSADLSRWLYVTPSNITGIIDRLEKKTLVHRDRQPKDRRVVLIRLTEEGADLSRRLPDPIEKKIIEQLADLKTDHVQLLAMAMNQILNLIELKGVDDTILDLNLISRIHEDEDPHPPE